VVHRYWSDWQNTQGKISNPSYQSLLAVTANLLHHSRCLFLRTWCWKDT